MDEDRFRKINDVRRCWAPPGIRPIVPFQIVREYTFTLMLPFAPFDGDLDALVLPDVDERLCVGTGSFITLKNHATTNSADSGHERWHTPEP